MAGARADVDAVVIGGGPAGLAAATWLGRYRRSTVVLDVGEHRNRFVETTHGYLGCDPVSPGELLERARHDLAAYPQVEVVTTRVVSVAGAADRFEVEVEGGPAYRARRLVLATGVRDAFPEIEGFFEHYGASVFHCPTCDGYEASERQVVAFGWTADLAGFSLGLLDWAREVTVITDGRRFEGDDAHRRALADAGVELIEDDAVELIGPRGALSAVVLRSGRSVPCELAFFSIDKQPLTGLGEQLGCQLTGEGCLVVDDECRTSVDGVFAAGDVTPGVQLVQVAAAKGAIAGVTCALSLR